MKAMPSLNRQTLALFVLLAPAACSSAQGPGAAHAPASSCAPSSSPRPPGCPGAPAKVFVEMMFLEVSPRDALVSAPRAFDFDEIALRHAKHVSNPHILVNDGIPADFTLSAPATPPPPHDLGPLEEATMNGQHIRAKADVVGPGLLRLALDIDLEGAQQHRSLRESTTLRSGQLVVRDTGVEAQGRRLLLFYKADLVQNDADLRRIFEAKRQKRDEWLRRR